MATWKCDACGSFFKRDKQGLRRIRFCSSVCYQDYRKKTGYNRSTTFTPGFKPWNKDVKGIHLSPESEFKKGRPSANKMPVGSETIRADKAGKKRAFVKIANPNTWEMKCRKVWKDVNGPIQSGMLIHHLDENTLNDSPDNLCLVTRATHINIHRQSLLKSKIRDTEHPGSGYKRRTAQQGLPL